MRPCTVKRNDTQPALCSQIYFRTRFCHNSIWCWHAIPADQLDVISKFYAWIVFITVLWLDAELPYSSCKGAVVLEMFFFSSSQLFMFFGLKMTLSCMAKVTFLYQQQRLVTVLDVPNSTYSCDASARRKTGGWSHYQVTRLAKPATGIHMHWCLALGLKHSLDWRGWVASYASCFLLTELGKYGSQYLMLYSDCHVAILSIFHCSHQISYGYQ